MVWRTVEPILVYLFVITWPGELLLESCRNNCAMLSYDASGLKSLGDNCVVLSYEEMPGPEM